MLATGVAPCYIMYMTNLLELTGCAGFAPAASVLGLLRRSVREYHLQADRNASDLLSLAALQVGAAQAFAWIEASL